MSHHRDFYKNNTGEKLYKIYIKIFEKKIKTYGRQKKKKEIQTERKLSKQRNNKIS
jgi:hypothetical protein